MKMKNRQVMVRAWALAKRGQVKFGGKVSEYLSESMKIAWEMVKEENKVKSFEYVLPAHRNGLWIAEITGTHPKFKLDRTFMNEDYEEDNDRVFLLYNGVYDVKYSNKGRELIKVKNGEVEEITYEEAIEYAKELEMEKVA